MRIAVGNLPDAALHRIFQLFCDGCPPETPGTCWLAPVCRRWRALACGVKGLRVLYSCAGEHQVDSFCAWLRRHAHQVKVLAVNREDAVPMLDAMAQAAGIPAAAAQDGEPDFTAAAAAAAAAGGWPDAQATLPGALGAAATARTAGGPLPLERLVVNFFGLPYPDPSLSFWPLLGQMPRLQHLQLILDADNPAFASSGYTSQAMAGVLGPLQHSTSLTSLVLHGPFCCGKPEATGAAHQQLLAQLPPTLRTLTWQWEVDHPGQLVFDHLTALTRLALVNPGHTIHSSVPHNAFTALRQLRRLALRGLPVSDEVLVANKEQLEGLGPAHMSHVLPQLTQLQALQLDMELQSDAGVSFEDLLREAPALRELHVVLPGRGTDPPSLAWARPWILQQYNGLTGLQRLSLSVTGAQAAPPALCALTQLEWLSIIVDCYDMEPMTSLSWVMGLAGLVNLQVLDIPAVLTASWHPWLTGLTRLVVLEVCSTGQPIDSGAAATNISRLLAPDRQAYGSTGGSSTSSSSRGVQGLPPQDCKVRVVCFSDSPASLADDKEDSFDQAVQLQQAVAAAVPVLPPNRHLFRGSLQDLSVCGAELWPALVAARLQQLM